MVIEALLVSLELVDRRAEYVLGGLTPYKVLVSLDEARNVVLSLARPAEHRLLFLLQQPLLLDPRSAGAWACLDLILRPLSRRSQLFIQISSLRGFKL